jgi:hypothetical protein
MIARIVIILAIYCVSVTARAIDLRTIPPIHDYKTTADAELKGREIEAIEVALRQFREDRLSASGDLKHFTVELRRETSKLLVSFYPEYHKQSQRGLPARNKFGTYMTYAVSLRTLKIIGYTYERD